MTQESTNKRNLHFVKVSPTGNVTILIFDHVARHQHASLANQLMDENHLFAEQVGYVEEPTDKRAVARLQMMGGEFCGNATRSLAAVLAKQGAEGVVRQYDTKAEVALEVSGFDGILVSEVFFDESGNVVSATSDMPIVHEVDCVHTEEVKLDGKAVPVTVVDLEGISHVIIEEKQVDSQDYSEMLVTIRDQLGLGNLEAMGVLVLSSTDKADIAMKPIVYVRETGSIIHETACGSGTVALGLSKAKAEDSASSISVLQPSGGIITANVEFDGSQFTRAFISGSVDIIAEGEVYVS